jgi:hypothetical protein
MRRIHHRNGVTMVEVLAILASILALLAMGLPVIARGGSASGVAVSLGNLQQMNTAFAAYANDFNGRQPTAIVDNFSTYGGTPNAALVGYQQDAQMDHPPQILGICGDAIFGHYLGPSFGTPFNFRTITPLTFGPTSAFGAFRLPNTKLFHTYVGHGYFTAPFYAPNDSAAYPLVEPLFDYECNYLTDATLGGARWSSYCFSPASMFDPGVMRPMSQGGFQDPFSYATGFQSPAVSQAAFPALKTRMLEHHWNQNSPADPNNPLDTTTTGLAAYLGCHPYRFNHGAASSPATLFFDGSTRLLPNTEALAADAQVLKQTGEGLWHRGTPLGVNGYFGDQSYDGTILSHHVLTTNGILGRDTVERRP